MAQNDELKPTSALTSSPSTSSQAYSTSTNATGAPLPTPLFIVSLGNPPPAYIHTRHSAGHVLLNSLAAHLSLPAPSKSPSYRNGLITLSAVSSPISAAPIPIALFLPLLHMNILGPPIARALRSFAASLPLDSPPPLLVILHDELELNLGRLSIKQGTGRSARGHNGLKSLLGEQGMKEREMVRVGVGIGPRPAGRGAEEVSRFVLGRWRAGEEDQVAQLAAETWMGLARIS